MSNTITSNVVSASLVALLACVAAPAAQALEITWPPETAALKESNLPGYQLAQRNCVACHSAQYMEMQPAASQAWWEGEVKKMKQVYAAPIPDADISALAEYLSAAYGAGKGSDQANAPAGAAKAAAK